MFLQPKVAHYNFEISSFCGTVLLAKPGVDRSRGVWYGESFELCCVDNIS